MYEVITFNVVITFKKASLQTKVMFTLKSNYQCVHLIIIIITVIIIHPIIGVWSPGRDGDDDDDYDDGGDDDDVYSPGREL